MLSAILASVNYLAVIVAAILAWIFSAAYYGFLGERRLAAQAGQQERPARPRPAAVFAIAFAAELLIALVLFGILTHSGLFGLRPGLFAGAMCWFGFVLATSAVHCVLNGQTAGVFMIDAGHWLGVFLIAGAVLGTLGP